MQCLYGSGLRIESVLINVVENEAIAQLNCHFWHKLARHESTVSNELVSNELTTFFFLLCLSGHCKLFFFTVKPEHNFR